MSNFTYIVIEDHDSSRLIKKVNAMIVIFLGGQLPTDY